MMVVPIAVAAAPLGVSLDPSGMMAPDPSRVMLVPPHRAVPRMMIVPITIAVVRICYRRRSREKGCQCCGGEYCSKFHSWYLLD